MQITIHSKDAFKKTHAAGKLAAQMLEELGQIVKPGVNLLELDKYAYDFINKYNTKSACYGYKNRNGQPFPGQICTNINHVVCHGFPTDLCLEEGDIIGIDVTLIVDGYHGDTCRTFGVGSIKQEAQDLIETTKEAMYIGINAVKANGYTGDIGYAIENFIRRHPKKYSIVESYCGHGIGTQFHTAPQIMHHGIKNTGVQLKEGMFFTVEPMINLGKKETRDLNDGWTVITKDYKLSAQFEHSIGIGENGVEIFTSLEQK